ncbi:hypothetical protein LINGRAHAP2_LOCUS21181 [Linum grandiflorum]
MSTCRGSASRSHLDDSDGEPNQSTVKDQHRCSPRKMHTVWKSTTVQRRNMCRRRGFGFVEHLWKIGFRTEDIQFFIKNYNTAIRELKVAEGRVVHFTEEDVERVYGLYRGGEKIDDIGGFQNCYIINWDKLAEADDVIWFESKELRSRRKKPGTQLTTRPAKKGGLLALGPATKCPPAEKSTVGVSKVDSSVGANKGPEVVGGFNPFRFPFTRLAVDHLSSDEESGKSMKKMKKKNKKKRRNSDDVILETTIEDEQLIGTGSGGIESGGFEAHDEGVNVGSFSDVADIGLDALLSAPGDDFVKEGFEVYASQVVSLDPVEDRMGKTFPEDNPEDAVGVESTLKEVGEGEQVGEGEHVTSGGSMEVETDAVVVDNIDAVETTMEQGSVKGFSERMEVVNTGVVEKTLDEIQEGNSEEEVSKRKRTEVSVGEHVRPGSKRIKYDSCYKRSPFQTLSGKKVIVKNSRLKIQVEAMRMQELATKEKELEGKEQDKEIESIAVEFPGPCT